MGHASLTVSLTLFHRTLSHNPTHHTKNRALQVCEPKPLYLALLGILERSGRRQLASEVWRTATKKFNQSCKVRSYVLSVGYRGCRLGRWKVGMCFNVGFMWHKRLSSDLNANMCNVSCPLLHAWSMCCVLNRCGWARLRQHYRQLNAKQQKRMMAAITVTPQQQQQQQPMRRARSWRELSSLCPSASTSRHSHGGWWCFCSHTRSVLCCVRWCVKYDL